MEILSETPLGMATEPQQRPVIFFMPSTGLGGAELAILEIIKQCQAWSFPVGVVSHKKGELSVEIDTLTAGQHLCVPFPYPRQPASWLRLPAFKSAYRKFRKSLPGDAVLFSTDFLTLWAALKVKRPHDRVVSLWQGEYDFTNDHCLHKWLRYGADQADTLCASAPVSNHLNSIGDLPTRVQTLNPPIDIKRFLTQSLVIQKSKKDTGLCSTEKVAICVGRIGDGKGQFALAEAFASSDLQKQWTLIFAGPADAENSQRMESICEAYQSIRWLGPIKNVPELLHSADLAIAPGTCQESFGLSHLETILAGRPLLCYRIGAVPYVIGNDYPGLLDNVGNMEDLLLRWADQGFLQKLCTTSHELAPKLAKRFSKESWQKSLREIIGK